MVSRAFEFYSMFIMRICYTDYATEYSWHHEQILSVFIHSNANPAHTHTESRIGRDTAHKYENSVKIRCLPGCDIGGVMNVDE